MIQKHYLLPESWIKTFPLLRQPGWILEALILRLLMLTIRSLSLHNAYRLAVWFCRVLEPFTPFTPKLVRNLTIAYPQKTPQQIEQLAREGCANIGRAMVDLVLAQRIWDEREKRIDFVIKDGAEPPQPRGCPSVFVTAHVGAWQLTSFVAARHGLSMTSVYAPEANPYLHRLVNRLRASLRCNFVPKENCMRALMAQLKQGDVVGFVPDLRLDGGAMIRFFGVDAPTNTTAARMALRHGCSLVPLRAERLTNGRFRITVYPAIEPDDPAASIDLQARDMTQKQVALFESWIRDTPEQWLCVGKRWADEIYSRPIRA